jgi:hypothetical protein
LACRCASGSRGAVRPCSGTSFAGETKGVGRLLFLVFWLQGRSRVCCSIFLPEKHLELTCSSTNVESLRSARLDANGIILWLSVCCEIWERSRETEAYLVGGVTGGAINLVLRVPAPTSLYRQVTGAHQPYEDWTPPIRARVKGTRRAVGLDREEINLTTCWWFEIVQLQCYKVGCLCSSLKGRWYFLITTRPATGRSSLYTLQLARRFPASLNFSKVLQYLLEGYSDSSQMLYS